MNKICEEEKCTGCTACMNVCPKDAISMVDDGLGFKYPHVNKSICVDCNICVKTCPINNQIVLLKPLKCYAAIVKDETELLSCASGGLCTCISKYIINNNGVVFGVDGTDIRNVKHVKVDSVDGLERLKKSKYVQSKLDNIFKDVKACLNDEKVVLFIGTPCQVAGLKRFLKRDFDNLYTIDLVCHGVPSQRMLNDNISYYTKEKNLFLDFRKKQCTQFDKKTITYVWNLRVGEKTLSEKKYSKDAYMFGFLSNLILRRSCYSCIFACEKRCGDLTLFDFWGLGEDAGFENEKGVSAVFLNTKKGESLFDNIKDTIIFKERTVEEAVMGNGHLQKCGVKHRNYNKFVEMYSKYGFHNSVFLSLKRDYIKKNIISSLKHFIKRNII